MYNLSRNELKFVLKNFFNRMSDTTVYRYATGFTIAIKAENKDNRYEFYKEVEVNENIL